MGTIGDCYDNAPMESFSGSYADRAAQPQQVADQDRAVEIAIAEWIEHFGPTPSACTARTRPPPA